ncbi:hypothetical protein BO94DRAFT_225951 [Aspergillus sclerotioniger CBS 115572]|uniref:Uncharacterized protein n=1 Tax=Aspergillus sclerotioniger CBS 115572 TaxID=1450535 RepID=A0A317XAD9_9EURO|nr:hypothetical protein BO94DRAFT_225951 [Aspergillus sclerotioniger CBS 115572]PWY95365.1 hypothetical protein BO94DRAFT_225951 [Aspergillus sclerotioniger CBS 115572]
MPPVTRRSQGSSILGESWVVASHNEEDEQRVKRQPSEPSSPTPRPTRRKRNYGSESISTSTSSTSGPELIMPSVYEAPISEGSWVAPTTRSKRSLRHRPQKSPKPLTQEEEQKSPSPRRVEITPDSTQSPRQSEASQRRAWISPNRPFQSVLRTILNLVLIAAISHMLVLPEIVQQYQTLCSLETIATLYPTSCIPPYPQPQPRHHQQAPWEAIASSQARLESLFNTTVHETDPLANILKQSESKIRDIHQELRKAYPGTKHELYLEFTGCLQATRTAASKFDTLRVDLRSAVDSLIASGDAQAISQDARLSTQMARREQYLDQLISRMQSKADSLSNDLATLDDHLESIGSIVARESKQSTTAPGAPPNPGGKSDQPPRMRTFVDSLLGVNRPHPIKAEESAIPSHGNSLVEMFREAATNHRPVIHVVRNLSNQLQTLQQRKNSAI